MDLALITAKQVFELFILILCGVVIGKIKMVNEEGKGPSRYGHRWKA